MGVWNVWGEDQGEGVGRDAAYGGVKVEMVVFVAPVFDEDASFGRGTEPMLVVTVITEAAVEPLDEGILHGFAWLDVVD